MRLRCGSRTFTDAEDRDLTHSVQHIEDLKGTINFLLQALKNVAASSNLDPTESANVQNIINAVGFKISPYKLN